MREHAHELIVIVVPNADRPYLTANQTPISLDFNLTVSLRRIAGRRLADAPAMNFQTSTHCTAWLLTADELVRCRARWATSSTCYGTRDTIVPSHHPSPPHCPFGCWCAQKQKRKANRDCALEAIRKARQGLRILLLLCMIPCELPPDSSILPLLPCRQGPQSI